MIFGLTLFNLKSKAQECDMPEGISDTNFSGSNLHCHPIWNSPLNSPRDPHSVPSKVVNLMIIVIQDDTFGNNFREDQTNILEGYIEQLNNLHMNLQPADPPINCSGEHIPESGIQFQLNLVDFIQDSNHNCTDTRCQCHTVNWNVYDFAVTNNPNLTPADRINNFPIIIVGGRGERVNENSDCNDDGCNNQNYSGAGIGFQDFIIMRGLHDDDWNQEHISTLAHELGHSFGLRHSWRPVGRATVCQGNQHQTIIHNCCVTAPQDQSNNIMDYDNSNDFDLNSFTECQLGIMHFMLENTALSQFVQTNLCERQQTIITIPENTFVHWDREEIVSEDVHVFGTLRLTCDLQVANDVRFIVHLGGELQVDGAHIFACDNQWRGIVVEGFTGVADNSSNGAGRVVISNNAIIENAKDAISMNPSYIPWPQSTDFFGGYVEATGSIVRNCERAVEFMRHGQGGTTDDSFFHDMTFENIEDSAVTSWANDGVEFLRDTFRNCGQSGILTHVSRINLELSDFSSMPFGIELLNPNLQISNGSEIISNRFSCDERAIDMMSIDNGLSNTIRNNRFDNGFIAIAAIGQSDFDINNNTFNDQIFPLVLADTNGDINPVDENQFNNAQRGSICIGDNMQTEFEINCFEGSSVVDIQNFGTIDVMHGSPGLDVGNCFTKSGIPEIENFGAEITYFIEDDKIDTRVCEDTENSIGIVEAPAFAPLESDDCGSTIMLEPDPPCEIHFENPAEIINLIDTVDGLLSAEIGLNAPISRINDIKAMKKNLLQSLGSAILTDSDGTYNYTESFLLSYYNNRPEFYARAYVPAIHITNGYYAQARQALTGLQISSIVEAEYVETQHIYLDYLESGLGSVSAPSVDRLRQIGEKAGPINGYARSVYYLVSGEKLPLHIPDHEIIPRIRKENKGEKKVFSIYPNPANSVLTISINEKEQNQYLVRIIDMNGMEVLKKSIESNGDLELDISSLAKGVYISDITTIEGKVEHTEKLIVIN